MKPPILVQARPAMRLLEIAKETCQTLSSLDSSSLQQMDTAEFPKNLAKIHELLEPHQVLAYRESNSRVNHMYQARVERRMAEEKRLALKDWLALEEEEEWRSPITYKDMHPMPFNADENEGASYEQRHTSKRKR